MNDDTELVARIRSGATDDFAEVVRRHQSRVFAILHRYERDAQRLEDLAQETFIKVWRALDQFDGRAPLEHWISRIAVRTAIDHLRRRQRQRHEVRLEDLGEGAQDWLHSDADDNQPPAREAAELLHLALNELSPTDRVVLTLQELEGRSVKEISALTGASGVAVRVRGLRARARLKRVLARLMEETK